MTAGVNADQKITQYQMVFPAADPGSFEAYRALTRPLFEVGIPEDARGKPFHYSAHTFVLDGIFVTRCHGTPLHFERTHTTMLRGGIDEIIVLSNELGTHVLTADGVERQVEPGQIVALDMARPARVQSPAFAHTSLMISRRRLEERLPAPLDLHGWVLDGGAIHTLLRGHIEALCHASQAMKQAESAAVSALTLDLVIGCLAQSAGGRAEANGVALSLSTVKTAIEQQLGNLDLGPASLMRQFAVSRPTLYRLFEPLGGVAGYINQRRLRRTFRRVTDPAAPPLRLAKLAFELGFASPTALGRAFREMFGMTPSQARALAWRPLDTSDSPWLIPKLTERFIVLPHEEQRDLVWQFIADN